MTNASNFSFVFFVIRINRNSLKFQHPVSSIGAQRPQNYACNHKKLEKMIIFVGISKKAP